MSYRPTPEQVARAEEKRLKRLEKRLANERHPKPTDKPAFLSRPWVALRVQQPDPTRSVKIMTWNLLAQCLVRSELFPTSGKARKANERIPMLHAEMISHDADILCMQEVDGLDKLLPVLDLAGYAYSYACGPDKPHGCLIAHKQTLFQSIHEAKIEYDKLEVCNDPGLGTEARIGSSHQTKNIANIVALQSTGSESKVPGYIIATTHLFWHPAYTYERARQAALLVREVLGFQRLWKLPDWPCILAGDFNFPPDDPTYALITGEPLSPEQVQKLQKSRVVHVSIDPTVPISIRKEADEGGGEEADPDRVIRNSRDAKPSDGLLSDAELSSTLVKCRLWSAYDQGQRLSLLEGNNIATYGMARELLSLDRPGVCEPMWTSFTYYWKTTLDYIFVLEPPESRTRVTGYLQPHRLDDIASGLPQMGICGSDHFSLCVQLLTSPATLQ